MKPIATDIYTFASLIEGGYSYVDKTVHLHELIAGRQGKQFFLARPRRFGKSLTVSTLQAIFEVRRELFKGLAIDRSDYDWKKFPVIRLDMSTTPAETVEEFREKVMDLLEEIRDQLKLKTKFVKSVDVNFRRLIRAAAKSTKEKKVVLLVDEYDKPLLGHLGRETVESFRTALKSFYSVIKATEGVQRFTFITGVSKFSKVSIFSDLNNLNEFSMDARVATLFGYTHEEVLANFPESLAALGAKQGLDREQTFARLVQWYDGYHFEENSAPVFNPVSVGRCLSSGKFDPFWFETGTPSFLLRLMEKSPVVMDEIEVPQTAFSVYEPDKPALMSLLYQTGFLTIKSARQDGGVRLYRLAPPNFEVSVAFSEALSTEFSHLDGAENASLLTQMVEALRADDVNDMLDALSGFFANIPANITLRREKYYQSLFYAVFTLVGARTYAECWTNRGRVDAVVETPCGVYVFEFKLNDTAASALAQIKAKGYHEKWLRRGKKVTLVGAAFDADLRNLSDRQIEVAVQK